MSGVYAIVNLMSDTVYVGSTVHSFGKRRLEHRWKLRNRKHGNSHLQRAWDKYGEDAFCFEVLEELTVGEVEANDREREQYWLDLFRSQGEVYNMGLVVTAAFTGRHLSEEHRRKISEANKGKTHSEEARRKMSEAHKGKTLSEGTKRKLAEAARGRTHSPETRRKISAANTGKAFSEEHRRKISEAAKTSPRAKEHRRKLAEAKSKPYPALYNERTGEEIPPRMGVSKLARTLGVDISALHRVVQGARRSIGGWILAENNPWNKRPIPLSFDGEIIVAEVQQLRLFEDEDA